MAERPITSTPVEEPQDETFGAQVLGLVSASLLRTFDTSGARACRR